MDRLTNTDKWKDEWFLALSPFGKLVFMFLCDNCNDAGFYNLNSNFMKGQLNIPAKDIVKAIREIDKKITFNSSGKKVWVDNFLFYQKRLPLDMNNSEHKKIKLMLEKNLQDFNDDAGIMFVLDSVETSGNKTKTTSTRKKFVKPTMEEFEAYGRQHAIDKELNIKDDWYSNLFTYYESNGWKVGKNPMVDWQAAIRKNITSGNKSKYNNSEGGGKLDKLKEANKAFQNIEVD